MSCATSHLDRMFLVSVHWSTIADNELWKIQDAKYIDTFAKILFETYGNCTEARLAKIAVAMTWLAADDHTCITNVAGLMEPTGQKPHFPEGATDDDRAEAWNRTAAQFWSARMQQFVQNASNQHTHTH